MFDLLKRTFTCTASCDCFAIKWVLKPIKKFVTKNRKHKRARTLDLCLKLLFLAAGRPWPAPVGWNTRHPQVHLDLDDPASGILHNGARHVETEVQIVKNV